MGQRIVDNAAAEFRALIRLKLRPLSKNRAIFDFVPPESFKRYASFLIQFDTLLLDLLY
jgi:hypothetical protein